MKRLSLPSFLAGGLLGTLAGIALGFLFFPFVFPPPEARETLAAAESEQAVATGTFIHAKPYDPAHYGKGSVTVTPRTVYLGPDFEVGPGPAYHVYLVADPSVRSTQEVKNAQFLDLGKLRSFKGGQNYPIPAGTDLDRYGSVVIWCERFSVLISPADLRRSTRGEA